MRIEEEPRYFLTPFDAFVYAMRKTLTASLCIEKLDALNFRCIVSLHNPTNSDFDFLYVVEEMKRCDFLTPCDEVRGSLLNVLDIEGRLIIGRGSRRNIQNFKDLQVMQIPAGHSRQFEIPVRQEERVADGLLVKLLHVGDREVFWIGEATKGNMCFWYYRLESEFVPLPLELQPNDKLNPVE